MKKITIIILITMYFILASCGITQKKVNIGFDNLDVGHKLKGDILVGAKSDTNIFNINDVKIDFYFGWRATYNAVLENQEIFNHPPYNVDAIALYIIQSNGDYADYNSKLGVIDDRLYGYSDYKSIPNTYFIKEFDLEEFSEDKYRVLCTYKAPFVWTEIEYNHYETMSVPREIFSEEQGFFSFGIVTFGYDEETNTYIIDNKKGTDYGIIEFMYTYVNEDEVKIGYYVKGQSNE